MPSAVQEELEEGIRLGINAPDVASLDWVNILPVAAALPPSVAHLGPGESEVIALGLETANSLLILDDLLARRIAGSLSLKCTGTLGILVKSKQVGLIPSVSSVIATLRVQGMWLSDAVVEVMLKLSGEQLR